MFAICNETFYDLNWPQEKIFDFAAKCGYQGVEIAPFTINSDVSLIPASEVQGLRRAAEQSGIDICGLHWILSKTEGLHLTSANIEIRKKTSEYLASLARFCRELDGEVMILGSPLQRNRPKGMGMEEGYKNAVETLQAVAPVLEDTGVTLAIEPLATDEGNFILDAEDAIRLCKLVGSSHVKMMLDCKAMWAMEPVSIPEVIRQCKDWSVHFHANDPNLQGPGFGQLDFIPIFEALNEIDFDKWVSVEVFDYSPGAEKLALDSLRYMKQCMTKINFK